jgi:hypothetical protein
VAEAEQIDLFKIWRPPMASASGPFGGIFADQLEKEDKANVKGEEKVPSKRMQQDLPIQKRFKNADEAAAWVNGWLTTQPEPKDEKFRNKKYGWFPLTKWFDKEGRGLYWRIATEGTQPFIIIEGERTVIDCANKYYTYFVELNNQQKAETLWKKSGLPVEKPLRGIVPFNPETEYHYSNLAKESLEKK